MLILIAHGSRDSRWRASVEKLTATLQADLGRDDLGRDEVRLAYMECTPPTLMAVASDAVKAGAKRIRVLPLFLTAEGHVARSVRPLVDQLRETYRHVEVELLPPVGQHRLFQELLHKLVACPEVMPRRQV